MGKANAGGAHKSNCYANHFHPSRSEAAYCAWLLARVQGREIKAYSLYPSIPLHIGGRLWKFWKIDFKVTENDDSTSYHESKGWNRSDDNFRMKLSATMTEYPDMKIYVNKVRVQFTPKGRIVLKKRKVRWKYDKRSSKVRPQTRAFGPSAIKKNKKDSRA